MANLINPLDHPICFDRPQRLDNISAWVEHIPFGMFLVEILRPKVFVELGSHTGVSYCAFCQAIKKLELGTRSFAVDTWEGDKHSGFYDLDILADLRSYHDPLYSDFSRLVQSTFDDAVKNFSNGSIDLLHIDGLHTYEAVKHDFETWLPKLSKNAVVLFHDTNVRERGFGVWKLWEELQKQYPNFEFMHGHGLGVLCVGSNPPSALKGIFSATSAQSGSLNEFYFTLGSRLSVEAKLLEKERLTQALSLQLGEKSSALAGRDRQLGEIYSSLAWRIITRVRKVKEKLAPSGGRLDRFIRAALAAIFAFRTEGFRSLFSKSVRKFRTRFFGKLESPSGALDGYLPIAEFDVDPLTVSAKTIAFYLPQFHPIPENDEWWGTGFTEWTNVSKAVPNFEGHYQPHLPGELGFYDLRLLEVQERQVDLAKKYGIYGFCFYYYWFAGKRLLERPIDQYIASSLDLPFCLCWANENWTRRWDGAEHDILIGQTHSEEEYLHFIRDIAPNFRDERYIRVDGRPLLLVYQIDLLPNPTKAAEIWRSECQKMGIGNIYLAVVQSFGVTDPRAYGFDAAVEFPPHYLGQAQVSIRNLKKLNPRFKGKAFDYTVAADIMMRKAHGEYTAFKTVMPSWDNTARKQNDAHIFINSSPSAYKAWLEKALDYTKKNLPEDKQFVFINAWNEWAEGTHLEPDRKYGYAYLQATADALTGKPAGLSTPLATNWTILFVSHDANRGGAQSVLLNTLAWFKEHTAVELKVICLEGGEWLPQFQALAETVVWSSLQKGTRSEDGLIGSLRKFCRGTPDLIYGNTVVSGEIYDILVKLNVPILTHFHEMKMSIERYGGRSIEAVLKHTSHYIACSEAVKENLIVNHSVDPHKVSTIYSAVVPQLSSERSFLNSNEKKKTRRNLGLAPDKFLVFGCGIGMAFRKGADLFIETARRLRSSGVDNFHFYWVGGFVESELDENRKAWKDYLQELKKDGLDEHVTFLGLQKNVRDYLSLGDVFLLPSREDPFPLVALEAAECGLPLICFDRTAGGMADFVEEDAGMVVPFGDVNAMVSAIIRLQEEQDLRLKLGARARGKFLNEFTVERVAPRILSTCRKIAGKKPAVSVIVPNYNHQKYLADRLSSIFNQSFRDFEVILLDDASTDDSLGILEGYISEPDVKLIGNDQNSGSPFSQWLKGIDLSSAEIIWIAESDDLSDLDFLKKMLPSFSDSSIKLAYANSHIIDETGKIVGDYLGTEYLMSLSANKWRSEYRVSAEQEINDGLGVKNTILNISSALFRKFAIDTETREKLAEMRVAGDWLFIIRAIKDGYIHYLPQKLNMHRRHSESVIGKMVLMKKAENFFKEFYTVQLDIFENYKLHNGFEKKWERYLRQQWQDFFPNRPFDEIKQYYQVDEIREVYFERR